MDSIRNAFIDFTNFGVDPSRSVHENRHIVICNRISLTFFVLSALLVLVALSYFGWILTVYLGIALLPFFIFPVFLNKLGYTNVSRFFLITVANVLPLAASIADKFDVPGQLEQFQYFHLRFIIVAISVFPFVLFRLSERSGWIYGILLNYSCLLLFDPLHEIFGVGFYQLGLISPNYYFVNFIIILVFGVLVGGSYFLKNSFETSEAENTELISDLNKANQVIDRQRALLSVENKQLNDELLDKNIRLSEMNAELVGQNNDLLQFSYSVSHNLRGPVASLLGLLHLANREHASEEMRQLLGHINRSAESLDMTIKDLNSIIEIRNTIAKQIQLVFLEVEIEHIKVMLKKEIDDNQAIIETNFFFGDMAYTVKPMINSILYNLISNGIKYRHPERKPLIKISTQKVDDYLRIDIEDNGLGIDVERHRDKLFGMYKRFHTHLEGKGLGLFLVKLQTESLGGKVEIRSVPGLGTTFSVYLKTGLPEPGVNVLK
jgi:signal transduction histidine kinase